MKIKPTDYVEGSINVGDIVHLRSYWKRQGKATAITAWRHLNEKNYPSRHIPECSSNYSQWFENVSKNSAYVLDIRHTKNNPWLNVRFFHMEESLWMPAYYFTMIQ
jgi:hypothetical protein